MAGKTKTQIIKETYENQDFGYGGINETYKKAHAIDPTIRRIDVKNHLEKLLIMLVWKMVIILLKIFGFWILLEQI